MMTEERVNQRFIGANVIIEATLDSVTGWQFVMSNRQGQHIDVYPSGFGQKGRMTEEDTKKLKKWLKERFAKDLIPEITTWVEDNNPPEASEGIIETLTGSFLVISLIVHIASAVGQLIIPTLLASPGYWVHAPGWQFEIGWWNVGIIFLIAVTLRRGDEFMRSTTIGVLSALWFGFAINHLREPIEAWHGFLAVAEFIAAISGFFLIMGRNSSNRS